MKPFEAADYNVFDMFNNQWGLVTAGTPDHWNTCTIGWGSLGTIWGRPGNARQIVTVYVNPLRYTWEFLKESDIFTVDFFRNSTGTHLGSLARNPAGTVTKSVKRA